MSAEAYLPPSWVRIRRNEGLPVTGAEAEAVFLLERALFWMERGLVCVEEEEDGEILLIVNAKNAQPSAVALKYAEEFGRSTEVPDRVNGFRVVVREE